MGPGHFIFIAVIIGCYGVAAIEYISVVAPSVTYHDKPYKVFFSSSPSFSDDTIVAVKFHDQVVGHRIVASQSHYEEAPISFEKAGTPSEGDKKIYGKTGYPLTVLASQRDKCVSRRIYILKSKNDFHTFIQLDKPFYKPGDKVQYRIFAIDQDTKPVAINNILVELRDSKDNVIIQNTLVDSNHTFTKFGLYEDSLQLSDDINEGNWKVSAKINKNNRITAEKNFSVRTIKLPLLEVKIEANDKIFLTDSRLNFNISAKFAFGHHAKGLVMVNITNVKDNKLMHEERFSLDTIKSKSYSLRNDLNINFLPKGEVTLRINAEFLDTVTKSTQYATKDVTLISSKKYSFKVIHTYPFESGSTHEFSVMVYDWNDRLITSSSSPVEIKYERLTNSRPRSNQVTSMHQRIKNSVATFRIETMKEVEEIKIKIKYLDTEITETVKTDGRRISETLRVFAEKNRELTVNDNIAITVEHTEQISSVVVLVMSRLGIVHSQSFDCLGQTKCSIAILTTKEMLPEAKIVAYSFQNYDKDVLHGSTLIKFKLLSANHLSMELSENAESLGEVDVILETRSNSVVSVLAIDKKLTFVEKGNDISKEDVIRALTSTNTPFYDRNKGHDITFDEANNNFIVRLQLSDWRQCSYEEHTLVEGIKMSTSAHSSSKGVTLTARPETPLNYEDKNGGSNESVIDRKYFPETWIWDSAMVEDGFYLSKQKVPDSMTTWLFTAFSLHKDHGLAIAEPSELVVSKEFFIELNLPYSVKFGEIPSIEVITFNFANTDLKVYLTLDAIAPNPDVKQFTIMQQDVSVTDRCNFQKTNLNSLTVALRVPSKSGKSHSFKIKPAVNKEMIIRVVAWTWIGGHRVEDIVKRKIVVINEGVTFYEIHNFEFKFDQHNTDTQKHEFESGSVKNNGIGVSTAISGDMMGTALQNTTWDELKNVEDKLMSYGTKLYAYKHMIEKNLMKTSDALSKLKCDYQSLMRYKIHFPETPDVEAFGLNDTPSSYLTAFAVYLFKEAMDFGLYTGSLESVNKLLKFCAETQDVITGSFVDKFNKTSNIYQGEENDSYTIRLSALNALAFYRNQSDALNFTAAYEFVTNAFSSDNYAAAISAYFLALADRTNNIEILNQLEKKIESNGDEKYLNAEKGKKSPKNIQIAASSFLALTYLDRNELSKVKPIVKWLMRQRQPEGYFCKDPVANVMATKAMMLMSQRTSVAGEFDMTIFIGVNDQELKKIYNFNDTNSSDLYFTQLLSAARNVSVRADGKGYALVSTFFEYSLKTQSVSNEFELFANATHENENGVVKVKACVKTNDETYSNRDIDTTIIMEFSLSSGYVYDAFKTDPMTQWNDENLVNVESTRGNTVVVLTFTSLPKVEKCIDIYTIKKNEVEQRTDASVKVYAKSKPDETLMSAYYKIGSADC